MKDIQLYSKIRNCQGVKIPYWDTQRLNIKQGWASCFQAIVDAYAWNWYITLTFRVPCGRWKVEKSWRYFVKYLRRSAGHRVEWFRIVEWQRKRVPQVPHIHATVLNCADIRRLSAKDYWDDHFGYARILPFNELAAGKLSSYLAKDLAKDFTTDGELAYFELSRDLRKYNKAEFLARYPMFEQFDIEVVRHA